MNELLEENPPRVPPAEQAALLLREARRSCQPIEGLPDFLRPTSLPEGYAIQRAFVTASGSTPAGYKVGLTSKRAQEMLNVAEPVWGTVLADALYDSGVEISAGDFIFCGIEPEVALRLGRDLPPREDPFAPADAAAAVESVHPAIEVVTSAYGGNWSRVGAAGLAADNGVHAFLVLGEAAKKWDVDTLPRVEVDLRMNGQAHSSGRGADALGGAFHVLGWLANALGREGLSLKAGDVVTTGVVTGVPVVTGKVQATARFADMGEVELKLRD